MADWNRIGRALGGFAAGYAGDGPQYVAALQRADQMKLIEEERKRKESQARQQSTEQRTANQIRMARQRMEQNPVAALPLINEMMMGIPGAERSPLGQIKQSILASQTTGVVAPGQKQQILGQAAQQLRALEDSFVAQGLLQPERAPEPIKLSRGEQLRNPNTMEVIAENSDPTQQPERKTAKAEDGFLRYIDTGERVFPNVETQAEDQQQQINYLRDKVGAAYKDYEQVAAAYDRIEAVGDDATPASDLALIFNYMKLLDPNSVVRESEFRTAEDAKAWLVRSQEGGIPIPAPIANWIRRADKGTLLETSQRRDFIERARDLADAATLTADNSLLNILEQADMDQIDRVRLLGSRRIQEFERRMAARNPPPEVQDAPGTPSAPAAPEAAQSDWWNYIPVDDDMARYGRRGNR